MSHKIYPTESPRINSGRKKSKDVIDLETEVDTTKSPRPSPRVRSISRQNSMTTDESKSISRQNSFQNRSAGRRRLSGLDDDTITDHSSSSARGKGKSTSRKSSRSSSKKKVVFKVPLIDPRPERTADYNDASGTYGADNSFDEDEFRNLEANDPSYTPRRMKKRRRNSGGKWRRWIPFGQYIPTLPSFFG